MGYVLHDSSKLHKRSGNAVVESGGIPYEERNQKQETEEHGDEFAEKQAVLIDDISHTILQKMPAKQKVKQCELIYDPVGNNAHRQLMLKFIDYSSTTTISH